MRKKEFCAPNNYWDRRSIFYARRELIASRVRVLNLVLNLVVRFLQFSNVEVLRQGPPIVWGPPIHNSHATYRGPAAPVPQVVNSQDFPRWLSGPRGTPWPSLGCWQPGEPDRLGPTPQQHPTGGRGVLYGCRKFLGDDQGCLSKQTVLVPRTTAVYTAVLSWRSAICARKRWIYDFNNY